jgi:hypothetical protein
MNLKTHGKSLVMLLAALVMAGLLTFRDLAGNGVTASEWVLVVTALFTTFTVWAAANIPSFTKAKNVVAAVGLGLSLLVGFLTDSHLSGDEIMLLVVQLLGALGVAGAPSVSTLAVSPSVPVPAKVVD